MRARVVLGTQARAEGERLFVQSKTDTNIVKYTCVRIRKIKNSRNRDVFGCFVVKKQQAFNKLAELQENWISHRPYSNLPQGNIL